jgi:hypothetical protein
LILKRRQSGGASLMVTITKARSDADCQQSKWGDVTSLMS